MSFRCSLAAIASLPALLAAQTPRTLRPVAELTIDAATADLTPGGSMAVSASGTIAIPQVRDRHVKLFAPTGAGRVVGRNGEGPGEFRFPREVGFRGDTLWVIDPTLRRATFFSADDKVLRSTPLPDEDPASASDPFIYLQAILPDGDLRAELSFSLTAKNRPAWAADLPLGWRRAARLAPDGSYRHGIASRHGTPCLVRYFFGPENRSQADARVPFCFTPLASEDGAGLAQIELVEGPAPSYRVASYAPDGRVAFSRTMPFTPAPVSRASIDSADRALTTGLAKAPQEMRDAYPRQKPAAFWPPVLRVVLGRDGSVWVEERSTTPGHRWRVLDRTGRDAGVVTLPADATLTVAELGRAWAFTTDADGLQGIVRYRLQ